MKIIYSGLESSGKSLKLAMVVQQILKNNIKYNSITKLPRPIYTNIQFSDEFKKLASDSGIPVIEWNNLDDLVGKEGCDILIDEIGSYFDSRLWTELSLDIRRWLAQCDKNGVNIYGTAQDFAQVDKSFRRLVKELYHITKILGSRRPHPTYPPIKRIWGICMVQSLNPQAYKEDSQKFDKNGIPNFFFITRKNTSVFNTNQKILKSKPLPYKHVERYCELHGAGCQFSKVVHS